MAEGLVSARPRIQTWPRHATPEYRVSLTPICLQDLSIEATSNMNEKYIDISLPMRGSISLRRRIKHFTWAWFACTMSTGGIAFMLSVVPFRITGLEEIGLALYLLNLLLFTGFFCTITTRFILHPGTLTHSFINPHEGFFVATMVLSIATNITNATAYGAPDTRPWLVVWLRIAFWIYVALSTTLAVVYYYILFALHVLDIANILPGWVLPVFPAMLVGTIASAVCKTQPPDAAAYMLVAGLSYKMLGLLVSFMMYALYFGRLVTQGLPTDVSRPAMFIAVGPPSFTALALIGMSQDISTIGLFNDRDRVLPGVEFAVQADVLPAVLQLIALLAAISLWMLAFFFCAIATVAALEMASRQRPFRLNWYAYVFPNVGFAIATIKIGERLDNDAIQIVGSLMSAVLVVLWVFVAVKHIKAVIRNDICWPGMDEDSHGAK